MKVLIVNSHALNGGDAAILFGEVAALRETFGSDIEIEVTDAQHSAVGRLYPELRFFPGFHSERPGLPRWRSRGAAGSLSKRRTSLAVRLLGTAPPLARMLMERQERDHLARIASSDFMVYTGGTTLVATFDDSALPAFVEAGGRMLWELSALTCADHAKQPGIACVGPDTLDRATSRTDYRLS